MYRVKFSDYYDVIQTQLKQLKEYWKRGSLVKITTVFPLENYCLKNRSCWTDVFWMETNPLFDMVFKTQCNATVKIVFLTVKQYNGTEGLFSFLNGMERFFKKQTSCIQRVNTLAWKTYFKFNICDIP